MAMHRTVNHDLPWHMEVRRYINRKGEESISYYYITQVDENGKRKAIPLGKDLNMARRRWAELEGKPAVPESSISAVYEKYLTWAEDREQSGLSVWTLADYRSNWRFLKPVFGKTSINKMKAEFLFRYFDKRSSKIRGKKEIKFLGTLFNWARARGYMTIANPAQGITRLMKAPSRRTIYVTDTEFLLVRKNAIQPVQDAMDITLLTGQRPADVFRMMWSDIQNGVLMVHQAKTGATVRISVEGELEEVLNNIRSRPVISRYIVATGKGRPMSDSAFKRAFSDARDKAEVEAKETGVEFHRWQFKDLRAKTATDSNSQTEAQELLGHKNASTTVIYRRDKGKIVSPLKRKIS